MNRIASSLICLMAVSAQTLAQLPNPTYVDRINFAWKTPGLTITAHQSAEFAPLNNLPVFPGGQRALLAHLQEFNLYPHQARINQQEGTVQVGFRVMATGELTEIRVVQSCEPLLDQAAVRVVSLMPRWYPAHREGVAVSCLYELPVTFRLD